ncbi:unnamed protein product [Laminaria digitata]
MAGRTSIGGSPRAHGIRNLAALGCCLCPCEVEPACIPCHMRSRRCPVILCMQQIMEMSYNISSSSSSPLSPSEAGPASHSTRSLLCMRVTHATQRSCSRSSVGRTCLPCGETPVRGLWSSMFVGKGMQYRSELVTHSGRKCKDR